MYGLNVIKRIKSAGWVCAFKPLRASGFAPLFAAHQDGGCGGRKTPTVFRFARISVQGFWGEIRAAAVLTAVLGCSRRWLSVSTVQMLSMWIGARVVGLMTLSFVNGAGLNSQRDLTN